MKLALNSLLVFIFLIISVTVVGQGSLRRAQSQYERGEYFEALEYYKTLIANDYAFEVEDKIRIAHSYYQLNNIDEAFAAFMDIEDHLSGYDLFIYASATHRFGFYEGAIDLYQRARPQNPSLQAQIDELIRSCEWAMENDEFLTNVRVNPSSINTYGQSFGIQYYGNGVVYSSASPDDEGRARDRQGRSFLSLYYSDVDDDQIANTRLFSKNLVFPYHVGAISFTSDNKTMYYTRTVRVRGGGSMNKIFSVQFDGNDWINEREVPFNSDEFDNAHPAVSPDDKYLYFVSNRPGGYGGVDLWRVERRANRTYGSPSNLGPRVNTFGDERYPFVSKDNVLYFASDGHSGFGGLDLFRAEYQNGIWGSTENMMKPFNSDKDDFGYVINPTDPQKGFLSTNRLGDGMEDVIFYVQYLDEEATPAEEEVVADIISAEPEPEVVPVTRPEPVVVAEPVPQPVVVPDPVVEEPKIDLSIFPNSFSSMVSSSFNGNALEGANVIFSDAYTGTVINRATTGSNGRFTMAIPDAYRLEGQEFEISVSKNEFNTRNVVGNIMELAEIGSAGFSLSPIFKEADLNEISGLAILYVGEEITPEGINMLDDVAAYLLANPKVVIKLNGHTDARGDRRTNLTTSQTVAEKAEAYLLSKGVPSDNLIPRGYGERYLENNCRRGKLCSDAEHLLNRRVEVVVWRFLE
jgi:hypothetical protein